MKRQNGETVGSFPWGHFDDADRLAVRISPVKVSAQLTYELPIFDRS
jgi:hypothetical protein